MNTPMTDPTDRADAIDDRLAARPVTVSANFTARTMSRVAGERRRRNILPFASALAAAACVALAVFAGTRPGADPDASLTRLLAADTELAALTALPADAHPNASFEDDLATLAELGDSTDTLLES